MGRFTLRPLRPLHISSTDAVTGSAVALARQNSPLAVLLVAGPDQDGGAHQMRGVRLSIIIPQWQA